MFIHSLSLHLYNRLSLQNIKLFNITFTEIYQLIIGTNGSGKSSIMRELTPMPANHKDYKKKGFKKIVIIHNGSIYHLVSDFTHGNNHAFLVCPDDGNYNVDNRTDMVDLNDGHTAKAQKALVEQHFGITQDIYEVLLGEVKFTEMSPLKRRDWILNLAGGDLEYALTIHRKLQNMVNDQIAIVKHTRRRISDEQLNAISKEEHEELTRLVNSYKDTLNCLYNIPIDTNLGDPDSYLMRSKEAVNEMEAIAKSYLKRKLERPTWLKDDAKFINDKPTLDMFREHLNKELKHEMDTIQGEINSSYEQVRSIRETLDKLANTYNGDINELIKLYDEKDDFVKACVMDDSKWAYGWVSQDLATSTWPGIYDNLIDILMSCDDNDDQRYSRSKRDHVISMIDVKEKDLANDVAVLAKIEHKLEHLRNTSKTTCPKCNYGWIPGVDDNSSIESLTTRYNVLNKHIVDTREEIKQHREYIDKCNTFNQYMMNISTIIKNSPEHKNFWDKFKMEEIYFSSAISTLNSVQRYNEDVKLSISLNMILDENSVRKKVIDQTIELRGSKVEISESILGETNQRIESLSIKLADVSAKYKELNDWINAVERMTTLYNEAHNKYRSVCADLINYWESSATQLILKERGDYQLKLSNTNSALEKANNTLSIIDSLNKTLEIESNRLDVCQTLADNLSPKSGLIAECIRGIIDQLVTQMNNVINDIWSYPMHVLSSPDIDDNVSSDLKYRFPLSIENGLSTAEDVRNGSSAQQDVVNFAFLICVYIYKELDGYPLYLDELAPTMDELHRMRIMQFVKLLIETKRNAQMFMISHYVSGHGVFTGAEICMLNDKNIINKPIEYNNHVVIK